MVMIHGHHIRLWGLISKKARLPRFTLKNTVLHSKELHVGQKCGLKVIWN